MLQDLVCFRVITTRGVPGARARARGPLHGTETPEDVDGSEFGPRARQSLGDLFSTWLGTRCLFDVAD